MHDEAAAESASELQSILRTLQRLEQGDEGVAFLDVAVQAAMELAGADNAALSLVGAEGDLLYEQCIGFPPEIEAKTLHSLSPGASAAVRSGKPLFIEDYQTDSLAQPLFREFGVANVLHLPIRIGDSLVGALSLGWQTPAERPAGQRALILESMAEQLGAAFERQTLLERLAKAESSSARLERFHSALLSANEVLVQRGQVESLFQEICSILVRKMGLQFAWIGLLQEEGVRLVTYAGEGGPYAALLASRPFCPEWYGPAVECAHTAQPVVWQDASENPLQQAFFENATASGLGRATACLPLHQGAHVTGLLAVYANDPDFFADDLLLLLRRLAGDIGFAIQDMETQDRARFFSHYDPLTNLPNEVLLRNTIEERLTAARTEGVHLAAMHVAIGDFMEMNDRLGYAKGDAVLREVAQRLRVAVSPTDLVARVGGAEFTLLIGGLADEESAKAFGKSVAQRLQEPIAMGSERLELEVNIGIARDQGIERHTPEELLRRAHMATYRAVAAGPGELVCFTPEIEEAIVNRQTLREQIARGLASNEFVLHYQPQVEMHTGRLIGFEALVRWQHPERGLLAPGQFLPAIEGHALMAVLGEYVLDAALQQMEAWIKGGLRARMNVNIAPIQLRAADFPQRIGAALMRYPAVDPGNLTLEIVESAAVDDMERTIAAMLATSRLGVRWALDDFGTGYSSLTHLQRLPVDEVKMDQSFTKAALADITSLSIMNGLAAAILPMRRMLVAEGVEEVSQGTVLLDLGCSIGQGFAIARPLPIAEIERWLLDWRPDPAWQRTRVNMRQWDYLLLLAGWQEEEARLVRSALEALQDDVPGGNLPDVDRCRLGLWCSGLGYENFGGLPVFQEIDRLHRKLHGAILKMLRRKADGDEDGATQESFELTQASADLIARMEELYDAVLRNR
ncbi:MAG: EAL domain-containing protein [Thermaerobacter sp.]|nr:EAL domain-containing protein [Thermaerobacter sp.]